MRSFYLLLMLLCGCCCCWTGGAANLMHLDGTKLSGSGSAAQFEKLRDGSLEEAFLASPLLGSVIRIELPEARKIDHLLLATAGGPDWSIARRISLRLDDGDTIMLEFPNHFRHAERFDVRRTARVLELKVEEVYAASPESAGSSKVVRPWGGFAEIEVNDAEDIPPLQGWYPHGTASARPGADGGIEFSGRAEANRILATRLPMETLQPGKEYRACFELAGEGALQLSLFEKSPAKRFLSTLPLRNGGTVKIPGNVPVWGEIQLIAPSGAADATIQLRKFSFAAAEAAETKKIALPEKWQFRYDLWTNLGDTNWTLPEFDDSDWTAVTVPGSLARQGQLAYYGIGQYRTSVELEKTPGHDPAYKLTLGKISGDDKAYFNGTEIGSLLGIGVGDELRPPYYIAPNLVRNGRNVIAVEYSTSFRNGGGIYAGPITLEPLDDTEYVLQLHAPGKVGNLFLQGETPSFRLAVLTGAKPDAVSPEVAWQVRNYHGEIVASGQRFLELGSGGAAETFDVPLAETGYYTLEARLTEGARLLADKTVSFGVLYDLSGPRGPLDDSPFGMNLGAAVQRKTSWFDDMPLLAMAGIDHIRIDINWDIVENERGRYDWTVADNYVAAARAHGLRIFPIMITVPHWNTEISGRNESSDWNRIYYAPDDSAAWKRFMENAVQRYHDDIREWEIWNEPNHGVAGSFWCGSTAKICELIRLGYEAVKANDPGATVIAPGMALIDPGFVRKMGAEGALDYIDGLSYHPYRHNTTPEGDDNTLATWDLSAGSGTPYFERDELKRAMREFGVDKPLYATELGWAVRGQNMMHVTPAQQAEYLVRYHAMMIPTVKRLFWYEFRNRVLGEEHMAIVHGDKTPLPAYVAFNVMVHFLRDAKFAGERIDGNIYSIDYRKGDVPTSVIWSVNPDQSVMIEAKDEVRIYDLMGVGRAPLPAGRREMLQLSGSPLYVTGQFELLPMISVSDNEPQLRPGQGTALEVTLFNPLEEEIAGKLRWENSPDLRMELSGEAADGKLIRLMPGEKKVFTGTLDAAATARLGNHPLPLAFDFNRKWRRESATAVLRVRVAFPEGPKEYLRTWLLAGPFESKTLLAGGPGNEEAFQPRAGEELAGKKWFVYDPEARGNANVYPPPEAVNLIAAGIRGDRAVAYAGCYVWSEEEQDAILRMSSDDGICARVNGREVFRNEIVRGVKADEDAARIHLRKGWNLLLLKISNGALDWCFIARLTAMDGGELSGVKYALQAE